MAMNLRHLRLVRDIGATGSASAAASRAHLSQPAVTQALAGLERDLGVALFERRAQGLAPTPAGRLFLDRIARALALLDPALADLAPRLTRTATVAQLRALIAVVETESFSEAARHLGLAQPTVHRAISQMEIEVGRPIFDRAPRGLIATRQAARLAAQARLAFAELDQARAELADTRGQDAGRIVVGAMPLSRSCLLGPAIASFRARRPTLPLRIVEGPFKDLAQGLRRGEIDWLIGALRPEDSVPDLCQEVLLHDRMTIVARPGHPLTEGPPPRLADLARFPWVAAAEGTPARAALDSLFRQIGAPPSMVETGSLILMREVLRHSDHLGFLSSLQVAPEVRDGTLYALPVALDDRPRPIGLLTRRDWRPTPAQSDLIAAIRAVAAGL